MAALAGRAAALPSSVNIAGSFQSELGASSDYTPTFAGTQMTYTGSDGVYRLNVTVPAGSYTYRAALDGSLTGAYGQHASTAGADIPLVLPAASAVKFYYDPVTHWATDNVAGPIVVAAGSFQSELGASSDFQPDSLLSWLQDIDGDGVYTFSTTALPAGDYGFKIALNESFAVNYGVGGQNGDTVTFTIPNAGERLTINFTLATKAIDVIVATAPEPTSLAALAGAGVIVLRRRRR